MLSAFRHALPLFVFLLLSLAPAKGALLALFDATPLNGAGNPFDPQQVWGWNAQFLTASEKSTLPVAPDGSTGRNAWQVSANAQSLLNPFYVYAPLPPASQQILQFGSRFSATVRMVDDFGGPGGIGLGAYRNNLAYLVRFDLDTTGALVIHLDGNEQSSYTITQPGQGTAGYHGVQLRFAPNDERVAQLWINGEQLTQNWQGTEIIHPETVQWGAAPLGRGAMNYSYVAYESGPFGDDRPGDFNGDGVVDAADYTVWRDRLGSPATPFSAADPSGDGLVGATEYALWKSSYGQQASDLRLPATSVPEPGSMALMLAACAGAATYWRSS